MNNYTSESGEIARPSLLEQMIAWSPVVIGLTLLYVPTLVDLFGGVWSDDEQAHGPIILGICCWLLYRKWPEIAKLPTVKSGALAGWFVFGFGLLFYVLGRSQAILQLEVGSSLLIVAGLLLVSRGFSALKIVWFPLFFMIFMVPLPGVFVQEVTIPLKTAVSIVSENVLFSLGYPVSRTGVILQVAQYQLLVADACAGLHTLFTLEALGLLYMNLASHASLKRNIALAFFIIPISFTSNVIRVLVLILITYYFGDAAGQGFLHGFAGMTLFLSALMFIIGVDTLLGKITSPGALHAR